MQDRAMALPLLNDLTCEDLIQKTKAYAALKGIRNFPDADVSSLKSILLRVSEMVCEFPWISEMDLNPILVEENGATVLDARIIIDLSRVLICTISI